MYVSDNSDICLILGSILNFWGLNGLFLGLGKGSTTVLGSTHVVEELSFTLFLSILINFDLILGLFFTFRVPNGLCFRLGEGFKHSFGVYSCKG